MRSPAVNLFNTGGVTLSQSASTKTAINYGLCKWYLTRSPGRSANTSWAVTRITVIRYYDKITTSTINGQIVWSVSPQTETIYDTDTDSTIDHTTLLPTDWTHHVSLTLKTPTQASGGSLDYIVITYTNGSYGVSLTIETKAYNTYYSFDFDLNYASWGSTTLSKRPDAVTNIAIVLGQTAYSWIDIVSPIATQYELIQDSGVAGFQSLNPEQTDHDKYFARYRLYTYYDEPLNGALVEWQDIFGNTNTRLFPIKEYATQTYVEDQGIRYADIDFEADFDTPSGSW